MSHSAIQMYAIKHVPTGQFLPAPSGRNGRGGSHMEPVKVSAASPPRLFHTEAAAKIALTYWLRGIVTVTYGYGNEWGECDESWHTEPQPHRKREEMAIVPIELRIAA